MLPHPAPLQGLPATPQGSELPQGFCTSCSCNYSGFKFSPPTCFPCSRPCPVKPGATCWDCSRAHPSSQPPVLPGLQSNPAFSLFRFVLMNECMKNESMRVTLLPGPFIEIAPLWPLGPPSSSHSSPNHPWSLSHACPLPLGPCPSFLSGL